MELDATVADDSRESAAAQIGPYRITGRAAAFPGIDILTAAHEHTGARVILRRLLPLPALSTEEARRRLQAFQEDARLRQSLSDPRHLPLFDFARNPDGGAYQAFSLPDGFRSVRRDHRALPLEEWTRIAAEASAALESAVSAGVQALEFDSLGLLAGPNGQIRLVPLGFPWPPDAASAASCTRHLAGWLYGMLAGATLPSGQPPGSLCDLNPRVNAELDMTIRAAMNPYAVNAISTPGEFARLLRDRDAGVRGIPLQTAPMAANSNVWANAGAWAVLLAIGGVTLGWLLALYFPRP